MSKTELNRSAREPVQAQPVASALPQFIVRKVEQAIHTAQNPVGMHTNGPCMAWVEVTHLQRLLRCAISTQPAVAPDASDDDRDTLEKQRDAIADYVADNWPIRRYALAEIEDRLRQVPVPALQGKPETLSDHGAPMVSPAAPPWTKMTGDE